MQSSSIVPSTEGEDYIIVCLEQKCQFNRFCMDTTFLRQHYSHQHIRMQEFKEQLQKFQYHEFLKDIPQNDFAGEVEKQYKILWTKVTQKLDEINEGLKGILSIQQKGLEEILIYQETVRTLVNAPQSLDLYSGLRKDMIDDIILHYKDLKQNDFLQKEKKLILANSHQVGQYLEKVRNSLSNFFDIKMDLVIQNQRQLNPETPTQRPSQEQVQVIDQVKQQLCQGEEVKENLKQQYQQQELIAGEVVQSKDDLIKLLQNTIEEKSKIIADQEQQLNVAWTQLSHYTKKEQRSEVELMHEDRSQHQHSHYRKQHRQYDKPYHGHSRGGDGQERNERERGGGHRYRKF